MTVTVVTPSHAPDFASFARLHASVVRHTDPGVRHIVAVPEADVALFESLGSGRLEVVDYGRALPRRFFSTTALARIPGLPRGLRIAAVNLAHPWPPIRGWMLQQVVKLAVVSDLESDVALLIDSDVVVVRPLREEMFRDESGVVRLYRRPGGVTASMHRHVGWQGAARELLGTTQLEVDSPDYISAFSSWDPALVRACTARVSEVAGKDWRDVVGARLDFSEFMLYGAYVMGVAEPAARSNVHDRSLCHSHWDRVPLTIDQAQRFVDAIGPDDVAVHIQSNSATPDAVLDFVAHRVADLD